MSDMAVDIVAVDNVAVAVDVVDAADKASNIVARPCPNAPASSRTDNGCNIVARELALAARRG